MQTKIIEWEDVSLTTLACFCFPYEKTLFSL